MDGAEQGKYAEHDNDETKDREDERGHADSVSRLMSKRLEIWLAWCLLIGSLIAAPISAFTFAKDEPKTVLILSWLAITLTAMDYLKSTRVHRDVDTET